MENGYIEESVRTRLILSGIRELEEHGIAGFSLRRAALGAQVSCAAPYRHFKDKDEYIKEIVSYVNSKWELLSREIEKIYSADPRRLAVEISMAILRFRIANNKFSSVFALAGDMADGGTGTPDASLLLAVGAYADYRKLKEEERELLEYTVRAVIAGTLVLSETLGTERVLSLAKRKLEREFI